MNHQDQIVNARPAMTVLPMIFLAVCLDAAGQMLYKSGLRQISGPEAAELSFAPAFQLVWDAARNWRVLAGLFGYLAQAVVWWVVLSRVDVSYAFPLTSTSYILLLIAARVWLNEPVPLERWLGVAAISFGVYLITRSGAMSN